MVRNNNLLISLFCVAALVGCAADNDDSGGTQASVQQEWNAVAFATGDSIVEEDASNETTRALFYGGNGGRFCTLWDQGDVVTVYKNHTSVGTMQPTTFGTLSATLTGTLNGPFAENDVLEVWRPSADVNYTGQKGTIYDLSLNYDYQKTNVEVLSASNQILTLSDVNPGHQQEFLRFVLTDETGNARLHPTRLELHAISGGHIVESIAEDGTMTTTDVLAVVPEPDNGEYPGELFVALLNDVNAAVTYRIKAHVGEDVYVGPINVDGQNALSRNSRSYLGKLNRALRKMRLTTPVSSLAITPIANKTFTGFAINPLASEVIVKDGTTPLTQGADYSYVFTNNVNAGSATLTVTGLAMTGEKAQTKYLGEKSITFNIMKATPVLELDNNVMNMSAPKGGATAETQTRTVTRVFIDNNGDGEWTEGVDYDITSQVTVSYTSSTPSVAQVLSDTGEVVPVSQGSTNITAGIEATDNWTAATAVYSVKVWSSTGGDVIDYGDPDEDEWGD